MGMLRMQESSVLPFGFCVQTAKPDAKGLSKKEKK
jgi:hypothetical protein